MTNDQSSFLHDEFFSLTLSAAVQRGKIYKSGLTERQRAPFQNSLRSALDRLVPAYHGPIVDKDHVGNIVNLAKELSTKHADILYEGRFRIGSAQKALNLYLKYLWCVGEIPAPPHCPFDSQIVARLPGYEHIRWTRLDEIDMYEKLVKAARDLADRVGKTLPVWELEMYNGTTSEAQSDSGR